jgi:GAF domain-containing protein/HAMP domain-containing protein
MYSTVIISSLHILIAIIQFALASISILGDRDTKKNRGITGSLIFFGTLSLSIGLGMNSLTFKQAFPWMIVESIAIYDMGLIIFLLTLHIFQRSVIDRPLVTWPIILLISLPILSILSDISGASQLLFGQHLMISIPEVSQIYSGGYLSVNYYVTGLLSPYLRIQIIASYVFTSIYPLLITIIKDRKKSPENSRFALILLFTTAVIAPLTMLLMDVLPPTIPALLANVSLASGLAYIVIKRSEARFGLTGMIRMVQDYPMFNKLLVTILGIILPAILLVGFSSYSFYQQTLLNLFDDNLSAFAETEGSRLNQEFESLIAQLTSLSEELQVQLLLSERAAQLQEISSGEILPYLEQKEEEWQEEEIKLRTNYLIPQRTVTLRSFIYDNPAFQSILVADRIGGLVIATHSPESYDQSQYQWWRWVRTTRQAFIGTPYWDEVLQENLVEIAIPIYISPDDPFITGIMYGLYSFSPIEESLIQASEDQLTKFQILTDGYTPVSMLNLSSSDSISSPLNFVATDTEKDWHVINFGDEDQIAVVEKIKNDKAKNNLDFHILALARVDEALSSVFVSRNATFLLVTIMLFIVIGATVALANLVTTPLQDLTQTAERILSGEKDVQSEVSGSDEIGTLASTFNRMTSELSNLVDGLERTVEERTSDLENRALQLETAALVARESAEIQDLHELLNEVAHLVSDRFGFYHAGIFLLDERGEYAVLQAANSTGGQKMLERGHKLQVGKVGVVGYTAGAGKPRIAQDVGADVIYYDNPDMPNTRSELALPLVVRGNVIGVLDVQSNQPNAFSREDLEVLQILSDQIALAIDNTRLLQTSQRTLVELEGFYGQQVSQAWKQQLTDQDLIFRYDPVGFDYRPRESEHELLNEQVEDNGNRLSKEISFRGQVIGTINLLRESGQDHWSEDEKTLVEEILEQTALALENARLLDQIRLRSDQIQLLQEITALSASLMNEEKLLESIAQKLYSGLELLECSIVLFDEEKKFATLVTKAADLNQHPPVGSMLALEADNVSWEIINRKSTLILYNVKNDPNSRAYTQAFSPPNTYTTILLPLLARGEVIGLINLETDDSERTIDDEDLSLFSQISAQVSTALDSTQLFSAEQRGRQAAAALLEISQIASSSLDVNLIFKEVAQKSAAAIQAHRCTISLIDHEEKTIKPIMSAFADPQHTDIEMWEKFKTMEAEEIENFPIYQQIYLNRRYAIVDVSEQPDLMPSRWTEPFGIEKLIALPLISQDQVFGVLTFDHINEEETFTHEQIELAQTIAGQIASTIENAHLFDQTVRRAERERLVAEITTKIRASNDPNTILNTAINELRQALKMPEAQISIQSDGENDGENHRDNNEQNDN